jgi:hypothetical protein
MELRARMRQAAEPYVPAGEQVEAVIPARFAPPWLRRALPGSTPSEVVDTLVLLLQILLPLLFGRRRMLVVTSTLIMVLDCGRVRFTRPRSVLAIVPRRALGPPKGFVGHKVTIAGETLRIRRRFFPDITAVG